LAVILVVGAGVVGLSVARAAVKRGHDVVLFEQSQVPNPDAASYDEHRMIRFHYGAAEGYARMVAQAFAAWEGVWRDLGIEHFVDTGAIAVSTAPGDYADLTRRVFARAGIAHEVLDAAAVERLCPHLSVPESAQGILAHPGGPLFADRIVRDLASFVRAEGVTVFEETAVVEIDATPGRVVTASGEAFAGDLVVVAAGAWLPGLLPKEFGAAPTWRQALCYVEPPAAYRRSWETAPALVVIGDRGVYTLPPVRGTGLKFGAGSGRVRAPVSRGFASDVAEGRAVIDAFAPYLRDPGLYRPIRMQVGYYVMDESRRFRLKRDDRRVVVTNCDGQMFKFGPLIGEAILASFEGERSFDEMARWAAGF
jgi:sarcosine oxidase